MRAEDAGEPAERGELRRLLLGRRPSRRTHPDRVHLRTESLRRAPRAAHDPLRLRLRLDQGEHALGDRLLAERLEGTGDPSRLHVLGHLAQRKLPQHGELVRAEEVLQRDLGPLLGVDLAGPETLLQLLRRQVDEHDLVGIVEDLVGEGLPHSDLGQLEDRVVETLEMLDVDGGDDVDAGFEHLLDVLPALLVAHPFRVRVGELVDERELRRAADDRVDVHLLELERPVLRAQPRNDLEALGEGRRLGAVVRLEVADHDVPPLLLRLPAFEEHPVRLADARRHPEEDPVMAAGSQRLTPRRRCG